MSKARTRRIARTPDKTATEKVSEALTVGVHITACLERPRTKENRYGESATILPDYPGKDVLEYEQHVRKLFLDQYGNLVAHGNCESNVFVCSREELPEFVSFLQKLQEGSEEVERLSNKTNQLGV